MLEIENLSIGFTEKQSILKSVSLKIEKGEIVALVGESGSGKTLLALSIMRLLSENSIFYQSGKILLEGRDILKCSSEEMRKIRGKKVGYIFQNSFTSLNPVIKIKNQIAEVIKLHRKDIQNTDLEIINWLEKVGIRNPKIHLNAYPHQLSGGMQQRVMIAMTMVTNPELVIADEPTTALDVTIQKQILDMLKIVQQSSKMALLLITHNFSIIRGFADTVLVMHQGKIVESGSVENILYSPHHPYTKALISCIPRIGNQSKQLLTLADFGFK